MLCVPRGCLNIFAMSQHRLPMTEATSFFDGKTNFVLKEERDESAK